MKTCDTLEKVKEKIVIEQVLKTMPRDLRIWLQDRKPTSEDQTGQLSDDYAHSRQQGLKSMGRGGDHKNPETKKIHTCKQPGHLMLDCPEPPSKPELPNYHSDGNDCTKHNPVKCYNCGMTGHFAASYPNNALFCAAGARMSILRTGAVEGMYVPDVVLDTGCTQTMV